MIEINLLPSELRRKKERITLPREFYVIGMMILGFLIVLHAATGVMIKWKRYRVAKLSRRWTELAPVKKEIDIVKREIADLSQRVGGIDQLMVKRFLWSEKLNQLSDLIVPGIWLRELFLGSSVQLKDSPPTLTLKGSVISLRGEEMAVVGKFMANLKQNKGWSFDFDNIELQSIQRREIKGTEIMDFVLICYFKEGIL